MKRYIKKAVLSLLVLINILLLSNSYIFAEGNIEKHILILNSYHQGYTWTDDIIKGIKSVLDDTENVIRIEYMDTKVIKDKEHLKNLYELYKHKYKDSKFDVILASDNDAYEFLKSYHEELFPDTPIIVCGLNQYDQYITKNDNLFTGISENVDVKSTIDLAMKLHPNTENIYVISDNSLFGDINEEIIKEIEALYFKEIKFDYIKEDSIDKVINIIKDIPVNSIIFQTAIFKDKFGELVPVEIGSKLIYEKTKVPLYSCWKMQLGGGVVGGRMIDAYNQGQIIANMAVEILRGKNISEIPFIEESISEYTFDYNLLKEFNINIDRLPKESKFINMPVSSLKIEKSLIYLCGIIIIIFLSIVNYSRLNNIKKLRKIEKELKREKKILKSILDSTVDGILVADTQKNIIHGNDSLNKILGIQQEHLDIKNSHEFENYIRSIVINSEEVINWLIESIENIFDSTYIIKLKDGRVFEGLSKAFIIDEKLSGSIWSLRDITKKREMEKLEKEVEIKEMLLEEAKKCELMKDQFFATISHELKTPLNIILGVVQLINELYCDKKSIVYHEKLNTYTKISKQNCYRLLKLINNLIDITKIDSGFMNLNLENHNIISNVEDITMSIAEYVGSKGIELVFDTEVEEKIVAFDADKLERIMLNLFSNAIKFTKHGGAIHVNIFDRKDKVIISVKDTGIGIPDYMREQIFDRFRQVDSSLSRQAEGSGIGLSLVKSIIELHNGKIKVISEIGKGSEFIIELPVKVLAEDISENKVDNFIQSKVERISIEFSDIYS
ncbi:ABC transporter substrate binding protein [Clostridium grantii]|uniref:histidine kinase n=1 Tax=Clostridium grantii DSM 8605 TaxID=1121316 RepID=A0A1M5V3F3_9CLOT|nr:ABC transporter substrate binding protein [Clostridium grantii]SHH69726.1 PAS domain S-box-containing protein [Clostridium grantii DSM 8605]